MTGVPEGDIEAVRSSGLFDAGWYLTQYPDVKALGIDPAEHYLWLGARLGRNPSPKFDTSAYLNANPDVAFAGVNPLLHYVRTGQRELRESGMPVLAETPATGPPPPADVEGVLQRPVRRPGDGRRLMSLGIDHDHLWYDTPAVQRFCAGLGTKRLLPDSVRRLLVIGHDYKLSTGVMRPLMHYLNALAAAGGYETTSLELAAGADALVALHDAEVHDVVIVNSLSPFFDHDNGVELMRRCGPGKAAIYLHETDFIFDKLERERPERYLAFAEAAREFNFLCVSERQRNMLARRFGARNATVVYNTSPVELDTPPVATEHLDPGAPLRIVMVGTVQPRKGVDLFSRVADKAAELGLPWTFHWAGWTASDAVYRSPHVEFVGNLDAEGVAAFIAAADIFFLSSEDDPFPLSCLEALQQMKRLIAYRKTGMSEVIDGMSGCAVYEHHTPEAAFKALQNVAAARFDVAQCSAINRRFDLEGFVTRMGSAIAGFYRAPGKTNAAPPPSLKIAAVVHLYYHDLWPEIRRSLENLRHLDVDLFVTLTSDKPREELDTMRAAIAKSWPSARIIECPNRGMDIGPFVTVAHFIRASGHDYDLVLKLHSKKSLAASGEAFGAKWRNELYLGLAGSPTNVDRIVSLFAEYDEIGMIGPKGMMLGKSSTDIAAGTDVNAPNMAKLADRMALSDRTQKFFRGSMFWARAADILDPVCRAGLSIDDFEPGHQPDNSRAHAMERLFACMVRSAGHTLYEFDETIPKTIRLLKDRHLGEDIYVVAAGASAGLIEPAFFEGKCVIGVNRVFVRFPCTYVIFKEYGGSEYEQELMGTNAVPIVAKWDTGNIRQGKMRPGTMSFKRPEYYFFDHLENTRERVDLSVIDRQSDKLVVSYSTITSAMHLAAYMGARNIVLVGHDCGLLNGKAVFDGYYRDMSVSPWKDPDEYKAWLDQIEAQTVAVRDRLKEVYGCSVVSLNPFVNFGLEGNVYVRG